MTEKRRTPRQRVLKGAKISTRQLGTSIDCTVRNVSETGACLVVTTPVGIPDTFDLVLADGGVRPCKVEWRKADKIGVSFLT